MKEHVTPAGRPVQDRVTALANALIDCTVQMLVPLPPWGTSRLDGLQVRPKSATAGTVRDMANVWVRDPLVPWAWKG